MGPRTVPKLRHGEVARPGLPVSRHPPSSQTSSALPPFPNKWSSSRLAAFLATRCHLSQAADRALKLDLDGRRISRMSEQAVGAALLQDAQNAKLIVDKLRTEA